MSTSTQTIGLFMAIGGIAWSLTTIVYALHGLIEYIADISERRSDVREKEEKD